MVSLTNLEQDYNYTSDSGRKAVWARGRAYWRANPGLGVASAQCGSLVLAVAGVATGQQPDLSQAEE